MAWIAGRVSLRTGERWEFRDPCLTTTEARDLATWLAEAAAGTVEVFQNPSEERIPAFTEPVLAFSVAGRDDCEVVVRVHLSLEALPGWIHHPKQWSLFQYAVLLRLNAADLRAAAKSWTEELQAYPVR
ncbi:WapI family immunity protein [Actinopolymorpha singaporensis]